MIPLLAAELLVASGVTANPGMLDTYFGQDLSAGPAMVNTRLAQGDFISSLTALSTDSLESLSVESAGPVTLGFTGDAGNIRGSIAGSGIALAEHARNGGAIHATDGTNYLAIAAGGTLRIDFAAPVAAFGFTATDLDNDNAVLIFGMSDGSSVQVPIESDSSATALFFGAIALTDAWFQSVEFAIDGAGSFDAFGLDEFSIGGPQQVVIPLPTGAALAGLGLVLVGVRRRR